jgi:hypothetical protein
MLDESAATSVRWRTARLIAGVHRNAVARLRIDSPVIGIQTGTAGI